MGFEPEFYWGDLEISLGLLVRSILSTAESLCDMLLLFGLLLDSALPVFHLDTISISRVGDECRFHFLKRSSSSSNRVVHYNE